MDKRHLVQQLEAQIRRAAEGAELAAVEAATDARAALDPMERGADGSAVELARMAKGQERRRRRALEELSRLSAFHPRPLPEDAPIRVGSIVEIEDEETGESRTFFLAPAGAGATLTGPDGDGHLTVVTPSSPVGRAVLRRHLGEVIEVTLSRDEAREWTITWVA